MGAEGPVVMTLSSGCVAISNKQEPLFFIFLFYLCVFNTFSFLNVAMATCRPQYFCVRQCVWGKNKNIVNFFPSTSPAVFRAHFAILLLSGTAHVREVYARTVTPLAILRRVEQQKSLGSMNSAFM